MIVAGIGLRASATAADLAAALSLARHPPEALALPADKADHPALAAMALPVHAVPLADLARQDTFTPSPRQPARYGGGSVAEAAALAAAGPGAQLVQPRTIAPGGRVTLALAEGQTP
ncbi:MAG: cobalamin biosynthesis protein [Gemmobacter sp.]|jgi:cobalt-precorrin 5A hydrolase